MPHSLESLLSNAQKGDETAVGRLFELYRPYLLQIANDEIDPQLKRKVGGSDLVQQSLLEAGCLLGNFAGGTRPEFEAWLRRILLNNLANLRRHYHTDKRNVGREVELASNDSRAISLETLPTNKSSDSSLSAHQEELSIVARALESLSPTQRLIIRLRTHEKKSFQEIGDTIGRSADATRKLWSRAIEALKSRMDDR